MREQAFRCLETAKYHGASYADVRIIHRRSQSVSVKDGRVDALQSKESHGVGVRVLVNGAWGFASTAILEGRAPDAAARLACAVAEASRTPSSPTVALAPEKPVVARWSSPCEEDPFRVPLEERIYLLSHAIETIKRAEPRTMVASGSIRAVKRVQLFASTEGSEIEQHFTMSGAGIEASAVTADGDLVRRSYPDSTGGQFGHAGYELVRGFAMLTNADRLAHELGQLIKAPAVEPGRTTVIIAGDQLALQIHESMGHPLELDRILGMEASFAGTSFVTPEDLGSLVYGSPLVSVTADATIPGGMGSFAYDDEGVAAQRVPLIEKGVLVGVLSSRETAAKARLRRSGGAMRADGHNRIPLIRMTNVNLEPGEGTLDELVSDTSDGLLLATNRTWSIDNRRVNFQFATEIGWRIKNGKLARVVRNPAYSGKTTEFWASCDAVCGPSEWMIHGTANCGKGEPMQVIGTGHGAAPARFRGVEVGVAT